MLTSIRLPPKIVNGRLVTVAGTEQNSNVLRLACLPRDCENPYQKAGIDVSAFMGSDAGSVGRVQDQIRRHLRELELSGRITVNSLQISVGDGQMIAFINYTDRLDDTSRSESFRVG